MYIDINAINVYKIKTLSLVPPSAVGGTLSGTLLRPDETTRRI